jgi:FO synthase subunit 1
MSYVTNSACSAPLAAEITYSPSYTLVPTYECFNRCSYCNFRAERDQWLSLEAADRTLSRLPSQGVIEILILSGEVHPHSPRRRAWFERIYRLCDLALSHHLLPHTNVGPLSYEEMAQLRQVNVSMGLMLEQITPMLMGTVHRHAPSKQPHLRLEQMEQAGKLRIPFTTGLLLGIGESPEDWQKTLEAIAQSHARWGHIQEVILQPHSPGGQQAEVGTAFPAAQLPDVVAIARQQLPSDIAIQIPPNLINQPEILLDCLAAGARDLGGIGPKDEVNPDYPHLHPAQIQAVIHPQGWQLRPRLPIYPHHDKWLPPPLQSQVQEWRSRLIPQS